MAYLRSQNTYLLGGVVLFAFLAGANGVATCTDASSPCVIGMGNSSYDNSVPFLTAVGCRKDIYVTFGSLISDTDSPNVELYTTTNIKKNSKDLNPVQEACCVEAPLDREKSCVVDRAMETKPFDLFECISLDTTEKWPGYTRAKVTFITPYDSDMNNDGQLFFCLWASHNQGGQTNPLRSAKYCITIQVQRCSACLKDGEGLTNMAKQWGTHWTQIYSANEDIEGTPDYLEAGRLLRLGPLYQLREGDTLMSVALKFGVSVNQLFYWNKYLRPLEDTVSENENPMSREVAVGHKLCVLPKTCYNSFVDQQPVFNQMEVGLKPSQGGGWADPPQVHAAEPQV
mmetsp:Transcript_22126/g.44775  ORF Transcript_22126/g.44775 Transcript_22126/m.44775 type:complete len:342 (+) Transcript_22126:318-1343(+)